MTRHWAGVTCHECDSAPIMRHWPDGTFRLACACCWTDPTPEEIDALIVHHFDPEASDDAEIAARLAMADGAEHVDHHIPFCGERKFSEITTPVLCGMKLDGLCFCQPQIGHSVKNSAGRPKSPSKRQESDAGARHRKSRAVGES